MDFFTYIRAVGTGPKGNRDLSFEESKDMMQQILDQSVPSEQIAAFLLGWRLKPETIQEFRGALATCNAYTKKVNSPNSLELGYPFDGKVKNPYIFPLVAQILQKTDLNLIVMGDDKQPAKDGITIKEIEQKITFADNIHYFDRKEYCNKLHKLTTIRNKLGLRTAFNTIEKLPQVAHSKYAITGVFHKPYVKKYIEIFSDKYDKFALIQGNEGTPELFNKGLLWIANDGDVKEITVDPKYYGINYQKSLQRITLQDSLHPLQNPCDDYLKLARLNAAIYLFITQNAPTIEDAYDMLT